MREPSMSIDISDKYDVAVLVPCYNEEQTIGDVVKRRVDELETENDHLHDYLQSGR